VPIEILDSLSLYCLPPGIFQDRSKFRVFLERDIVTQSIALHQPIQLPSFPKASITTSTFKSDDGYDLRLTGVEIRTEGLIVQADELAYTWATGEIEPSGQCAPQTNPLVKQSGSSLKDRMKQIMPTQIIRSSSRLIALAVILPLGAEYLQGQALPDTVQGRDEAIRHLQAELDKNPKSTELRTALGNLFVRMGQDDKAVAEFQRVLDTGRNLNTETITSLYFGMADCFRRMGDSDAAIRMFQQAAAANPKDPRAPLQIGLLMGATGRPDQAGPYYEQVLKIQPDNAVALNNLASLKADEGRDLDQALIMAQQAREKAPYSAQIADTLGWVYLKKNMNAEAITAFHEALQKDSSLSPTGTPQTPELHYHLAMALNQNGEIPAAVQELKTALASRPSENDKAQIEALLQKLVQPPGAER
jgi:tetratricopeptide (TPR) repeat protein